jgi:hypothetical protein
MSQFFSFGAGEQSKDSENRLERKGAVMFTWFVGRAERTLSFQMRACASGERCPLAVADTTD